MQVDSIRIRGRGYADTGTRIWIRGYGYVDTDIRIRIRGCGYADTDTRIRIRGYGYLWVELGSCFVGAASVRLLHHCDPRGLEG